MPWTTKIGNSAKTLVLALANDGVLVSFGSLSGPGGVGAPQLRIRRKSGETVLSFDLEAYAGADPDYNAQRVFTADDFGAIDPGLYIAEVDARISGQDVTFPDDGFLELRFLRGLDES